MNTQPLVTCVCPTIPDRRAWLPRVLECFVAQTYANKELLFVTGACSVFNASMIRLRAIEGPMILGDRRNAGVEGAFGDIIVQIDDDDYSHPQRIAEQVALLESSGKPVVGYNSYTCQELRPARVLEESGWKPTTGWWEYRALNAMCAGGSSLAYRREWALAHPFPPEQLGEDSVFCAEAARLHALALADGVARLCVTNHRGGSSGRLIGGAEWTEIAGRPEWVREAVAA